MRSIVSSRFIFFILLSATITSCVNLKTINDYSSNSVKSLKKFEEIGYTFNKACLERCQLEQLRNLRLRSGDCNCRSNQQADSITLLINNSIKGYFEGLAKLSNKEVTNYKFDALTKSLKEGEFGDLKVNKEEVDAYAKISNILLRATTDIYRKKKITKYIEDANEAIRILIKSQSFNLVSNLNGKLNVRKQRLESIYFEFVNDSQASSYEKKKAIEDYNNAITEVEIKQKQIIAFSKGLNSIDSGHQKLYDNRNKITSKDLKEVLSQYASDIQDIVDEFNKLKNQD